MDQQNILVFFLGNRNIANVHQHKHTIEPTEYVAFASFLSMRLAKE